MKKARKKKNVGDSSTHTWHTHSLKHRNTETVGTRKRHRNLFFRIVRSHFASILLDLLSYSTVNSYLHIYFLSFIELNLFTMQNGLNSRCEVPSRIHMRRRCRRIHSHKQASATHNALEQSTRSGNRHRLRARSRTHNSMGLSLLSDFIQRWQFKLCVQQCRVVYE